MNDNLILDKSLDFALRIVKLCHYLNETKREFVLSKELLISGTNIGKHVKAAVGAENRETFILEFGIARRRALRNRILASRTFSRRHFSGNGIQIDRGRPSGTRENDLVNPLYLTQIPGMFLLITDY